MDRRKALGQYLTREWVAEALVERYFGDLGGDDCVIDAGCGLGAFLGAIPREVPALGVDVDERMVSLARERTGREVILGDFRTVPIPVSPTVVLGNPPFSAALVDSFLARAHRLLPDGGRVGFVLPAYLMQTARHVADYAERWSMAADLIPRNVFPGLSLPLVFARFFKDRRRILLGFALYLEAADIQNLSKQYRRILDDAEKGSVWLRVVEAVVLQLGGVAGLQDIFREIEPRRPTRTEHWRQAVRRTVRRYPSTFIPLGRGRYAHSSYQTRQST